MVSGVLGFGSTGEAVADTVVAAGVGAVAVVLSPQVAGPGVDRACYSGAVEKSGLLSSIEKEKEQDA